mgnify:FL=1
MGKLTLLLLAILVWLQYSLWFGKNGIHDYTRVNNDVAAQQATNAKLKARNDQLFAEIEKLAVRAVDKVLVFVPDIKVVERQKFLF